MIHSNYKHESGCCDAVFSFTLEIVKLFSRIPLIFVALCSMFSSFVLADIAEICNVPKKLTFTSIAHPKVQNEIQPLIADVYKALGIEVEFVVIASLRDLKLLSSGQVMGAAIYSEDIIEGLDGIIKLQPAILTTSNMLLCKKGVPCLEQQLFNYEGDKPVAVSRAMSGAFLKQYPDFDKEHLLITNEMKNVLNLIRFERVDYGIYPVSDHTKGGLNELPSYLDSEFLYSVSSYHIISSDLACLKSDIEQVLADKLVAAQ